MVANANGNFVVYVDGLDRKGIRKSQRIVIVAAALAISMVASVALAMYSQTGGPSALAQRASTESDVDFAMTLLKLAPTSSLELMNEKLRQYSTSGLNPPKSQLEQLSANFAPRLGKMLAEEKSGPKLCPKAHVVIAKLDSLYNKLTQKDRANSQGLADLKANEDDSEEQYMDSQTAYDLASREKEESEKGEHYATDKYETYLDTVKLAEENIAKLRMDVEARERVVDSEREMILKLLRMLSTISQVGPSAQGIAAGGYVANVTESGVEARKDGDAGDKMEEIKHQIAEVKARAVQIGGAELTKASKLTKLMDYKETDEVKAILLAMLKDLEGRSALLQDQLDAAEKTLADHKAKLAMYQKDMISLADDADRENHRLLIAHGNAAETEANKVTADEEYKDGVFAHRELESNSLKEMAIIIRIQLKLQDFCSGYFQANNVSTGNANKFFRDNVIDLQDPADSHWCVSAYFVDGYDGSTILNVDDKRPDFAVEADDLTFTEENKPREIWRSGFEGQGGVTGIKGPNLISQDEAQELTSSPMALTMAVDRKAASIVEEIKQGVEDARASPGAGGVEGVQAGAGRRLKPVSRDEEAIKKRDDSKSGLFMSAVGVVKVGEDGEYSLCTESDKGAWLFVDGKRVVGGSGSRCAKTDLKAGFHFVRALYGEGGDSKGIAAGGAGSMFKVTGAKCERGGACAERKQLRTKMSWPPRCGDAVKYTGSIDNFGQDAADA